MILLCSAQSPTLLGQLAYSKGQKAVFVSRHAESFKAAEIKVPSNLASSIDDDEIGRIMNGARKRLIRSQSLQTRHLFVQRKTNTLRSCLNGAERHFAGEQAMNGEVVSGPWSKWRWRIVVRIVIFLALAALVGWFFKQFAAAVERNPHPAGFARGMLQGALMPMALPNLLVGNDVTIYAQHNTGLTYKLGYTTGVNVCGAIFFGAIFWRVNKWRKKKS